MRDFIESLELDVEEAVSTAVEEFEMQGLSMDGVDRAWPPESRQVHPVAAAFGVVREQLGQCGDAVPGELVSALADVEKIVSGEPPRPPRPPAGPRAPPAGPPRRPATPPPGPPPQTRSSRRPPWSSAGTSSP